MKRLIITGHFFSLLLSHRFQLLNLNHFDHIFFCFYIKHRHLLEAKLSFTCRQVCFLIWMLVLENISTFRQRHCHTFCPGIKLLAFARQKVYYLFCISSFITSRRSRWGICLYHSVNLYCSLEKFFHGYWNFFFITQLLIWNFLPIKFMWLLTLIDEFFKIFILKKLFIDTFVAETISQTTLIYD